MNVFDLHIGNWSGTHTVLDAQDREIDRFEARVECRRDGQVWRQKTTRTWADGTSPATEFTGTFRGENELIYDHPNVQGRGVAMSDRDIVSAWVDPDVPGIRFIGIITLLANDERVRTVQKIENDQLAARLLIRERRV